MPRNKPAERTARLSARITPRTEQQIRDLAQLWGGLRPLSPAAVAEIAIEREWTRETQDQATRGD